MNEIKWNTVVYREFLRLSILTDLQRDVLDLRVLHHYPAYRIAMELNCSESTINRTLRDIREIYDYCQQMSPILPPRIK